MHKFMIQEMFKIHKLNQLDSNDNINQVMLLKDMHFLMDN